jgi:long-chain acyl-CoA synthetase
MFIQDFGKTALTGKGFTYTYNQLLKQIDYYSYFFKDSINGKVVIFSENRPEWVFAFYASWKNAQIVVPIDYMSVTEEVAYILNDCKPGLIFCSQDRYAIIDEAIKLTNPNIKVITFERAGIDLTVGDYKVAPLNITDATKTAVIIYTSGTTGAPKGVMLSFNNLLANFDGVVNKVPIYTKNDRIMMLLPLHHIFPLMGTMLLPLFSGGTIAMSPSLAPQDIAATLFDNQITIVIGVPRLYNALRKSIVDKIKASLIASILFFLAKKINSKSFSKTIFKTVHTKLGGCLKYFVSGGAAISPDVVRDFQALGIEVLEGYGMTEAAPMITFTRPSKTKFGSAGHALPGIDVKFIDGEIIAKGSNIMQGYYNKPQETDEILKDGWLYTGDIGHIDKKGHIFITGRKKDIIILSNGKNINPEEIEEKVESTVKGIKEVGVFSMNDSLQAIIFPDFIKLSETGTENLHEYFRKQISENFNSNVSSYKKIMGITLVNEPLPKSRLGKIQHFKLPEFARGDKSKASELQVPDYVEFTLISKYLKDQLDRVVLPTDHLELDLALDSLGKVGLLVFIQSSFGIEIHENELAKFGSLEELTQYIKLNKTKLSEESINWSDILKASVDLKLPKSRIVGLMFRYLTKILMKSYFRLRTEGLSNLPDGPCIITPNHQSIFDGFLITAILKNKLMQKTYFYAKEKHFKAKWLKALAQRNNIIVIDMNKDLKQSIQKLAEVLKKGRNIIIFPEGTRSKDGKLGQFKKTFAILSQELNVPVVPLVISGISESRLGSTSLPRPFSRIGLKFCQPIYPVNHTYETLKEQVYKRIAGEYSSTF